MSDTEPLWWPCCCEHSHPHPGELEHCCSDIIILQREVVVSMTAEPCGGTSMSGDISAFWVPANSRWEGTGVLTRDGCDDLALSVRFSCCIPGRVPERLQWCLDVLVPCGTNVWTSGGVAGGQCDPFQIDFIHEGIFGVGCDCCDDVATDDIGSSVTAVISPH